MQKNGKLEVEKAKLLRDREAIEEEGGKGQRSCSKRRKETVEPSQERGCDDGTFRKSCPWKRLNSS